MKQLKILTNTVGYDGFERSILLLANSLSDVFNIEIICLYKKYDILPVKIDKKVKITYINDKPTSINLLSSMRIKKVLKNIEADTILYTDLLFAKFLVNIPSKKVLWDMDVEKNYKFGDSIINNKHAIDMIVVPSEYMFNLYSDVLEENDLNIELKMIPNAVYSNTELKSSLDEHNVIIVGKLKDSKRLIPFLDVFRQVVDVVKDAKLTIVGDGEQRMLLNTLVEEYRLSKNVRFTGYLDYEDMLEELSKSSVFVNPSHENTFGLILLEALKINIPAIVFEDTLKITDCVRNEINGFVVSDDDEMADKLIEILSDDELRHNLGGCAEEIISSYDKNATKIEWIKYL